MVLPETLLPLFLILTRTLLGMRYYYPHSTVEEAEVQNGQVTWLMSPSWYVKRCWDPQRVPLFSLSPHSTQVPQELWGGVGSVTWCEGIGPIFTAYSWVVFSISSNHEVWYGRKPTILRSLKRTLTKISGLSESPWKLVHALSIAICCLPLVFPL